MRAHAEEVNRLNRERRANNDIWRAELAKIEKQIQSMVEAIKEGMFQRTMITAMDTLEARKGELTAHLAETPANTPDLLPSASQLYAEKVAHLTEALNRPEDRAEAAQTLRGLIERIVLRPGPKRGQVDATLHGELGTILGWTAARSKEKGAKTKTPAASATGVSVSVVAGTRYSRPHRIPPLIIYLSNRCGRRAVSEVPLVIAGPARMIAGH